MIFRAHPFNYRYPDAVAMIQAIGAMLDADRARSGRKHLWGADAEQAMTIEDCFNASDAMISDVSAVVSDYLRADKPFAIVSVGRTPEQLLHDVPAARAAYVLRDDLSNLEPALEDLLSTDSDGPGAAGDEGLLPRRLPRRQLRQRVPRRRPRSHRSTPQHRRHRRRRE